MSGYGSAVTWLLVKCRVLEPSLRPTECESQCRRALASAFQQMPLGMLRLLMVVILCKGSRLRLASLTCHVVLGNQLLSLIPISITNTELTVCPTLWQGEA